MLTLQANPPPAPVYQMDTSSSPDTSISDLVLSISPEKAAEDGTSPPAPIRHGNPEAASGSWFPMHLVLIIVVTSGVKVRGKISLSVSLCLYFSP